MDKELNELQDDGVLIAIQAEDSDCDASSGSDSEWTTVSPKHKNKKIIPVLQSPRVAIVIETPTYQNDSSPEASVEVANPAALIQRQAPPAPLAILNLQRDDMSKSKRSTPKSCCCSLLSLLFKKR